MFSVLEICRIPRYISMHHLNDGTTMKMKTFLLILLGLSLAVVSSLQAAQDTISIVSPADGKVIRLDVAPGSKVFSGDTLALVKADDGRTIILKAGVSGTVSEISVSAYQKNQERQRTRYDPGCPNHC